MLNENDTLYSIDFDIKTGISRKVNDGFLVDLQDCQEHKTCRYFISLDEAIDATIEKLYDLKNEYLNKLNEEAFDGVPWIDLDEKKRIIAEYGQGSDSYWCSSCGYKCCLDRGKHFQCQLCGCDWEYGGNRFKEPEKFEKFRKDMILKLTTHNKRYTAE